MRAAWVSRGGGEVVSRWGEGDRCECGDNRRGRTRPVVAAAAARPTVTPFDLNSLSRMPAAAADTPRSLSCVLRSQPGGVTAAVGRGVPEPTRS